jgi:hypothetical protein
MRKFREYAQHRQLIEAEEQAVSGSGIDELKSVFVDMFHRGAPNEYNDRYCSELYV